MNIHKTLTDKDLVIAFDKGEVGLLPTDTIYGLSCSAYNKSSVERIYDIKGRDKKVPLIVLVSGVADLKKFRINLDKNTERLLASNWPGKISVILPVQSGFDYLTRGSVGLAFRAPDNDKLLSLLQKTGPLVSTSANPAGLKPAENVEEADNYFGDKLDFYVDVGNLVGSPSTLVDLTGSTSVILRQGETPFKIL